VIAIAIRPDELGTIGSLAPSGAGAQLTRTLGEVDSAGPQSRLKARPVLGLDRAAGCRGALLEPPDQIVVHLAYQQLAQESAGPAIEMLGRMPAPGIT